MAFEILGDAGFHRELDALPVGQRGRVVEALGALIENPLRHPKVRRLTGGGYPGSFRMRVGEFRVLGIALESQRLVFLTTLFTKKRDSDYDAALRRHEARLRLQGPPIDEALRGLRKKRA